MSAEDQIGIYLEESRYSLIKDIYTAILLIFVPLSLLYALKTTYIFSYSSLLSVILILLSFIFVFIMRFWLMKKHLLLCYLFIILLLFFFSIFSLFTKGIFSSFPFLFITTTVLLSLVFVDERLAFLLLLLFILSSLATLIFLPPKNLSSFDLYETFQSLFLLISLIYILYRSYLILKICQKESTECLQKYKTLADLEYRNRLVGKISKCILHDIATPLSVLSGSLNIMSKVSSDEDLEDINQSASESLRCIEEILEGSFNILRKKGVVEKFKTNEVIEKVIDMLSWRLKSAGISVRKQLLKETYIVGDRSSFSRIFLNLLLNSVEELEMCGKKERYIYIKTWVSEDRFFFSIKDTGRGIRDTLLDDIQNKRFYSSDCNHLGVGLFFVFNTVRSCFNGEVRIETELGDYTNVEICIPL